MIEIITDFERAAARLSRLGEGVSAAIDPELAETSEAIKTGTVAIIKAHTPYGYHEEGDGGEHLRDTTEGEVTPDLLGSLITFRQTKTIPVHGDDYPLAELLRTGTAPHTITASTAGALFWPGALHPVKSVNHPGTSPNPYVAEAMTEADSGVDSFLTLLGGRILSTAIGVMG